MIEPFRYLIQPVAVERDESGRVVRELPGEVITVYDAGHAEQAILMFEAQLHALTNGHKETDMPVETETVTNISCDNPACPGNDLDPTDRTGWTFVNREVYGSMSEQFVYCCAECSGTLQAVPVPPPLNPPIDAGEPIPG